MQLKTKKVIAKEGLIVICIIILSATGIQDWLAKLLGRKHTKKDLEDKIASLENRIEKLERSDAVSSENK